ncbi:MAG: vWA domain-containing protein [Bacteroidota bacterium]
MQKLPILFATALLASAMTTKAQLKKNQPSIQTQENRIPYLPKQNYDQSRPHIQVVFALDATGSMSGLIKAAKEKIWSIAGSLSQTEQAPKIEIGLLFYRDKGDDFVTRTVMMQEDLDKVYEKLMDIQAGGGGDEPESVNLALNEAINHFAWSQNPNTYKTVFLVGDCPPHMDYREIQYPASCIRANEKDITINTILMGNNREAERIWKSIAAKTNGSFTKVGMDVNDITVNTPYDQQISDISDQLDELRYSYGNKDERIRYEEKKMASRKITSGSAVSTKAQRAEYNATAAGKSGYTGSKELLNDVAEGKVKASALKQEELPEELKNLRGKELEIAVQRKIVQRDSLNKKMILLSRKRQEFIDADLNKRDQSEVENSFNYKVYDNVKKQAAKKNIKLKEKAKF